MDRTPAVIVVILVVALLGGLLVYSAYKTDTPLTATSTPTTTGQSTQAGAPLVATNPNAVTSDTTAIVNGTVTPNGAFTNYWYEYGTTASLGKTTSRQMLGSGQASIEVPSYITGLTKDTTYHFRVVAENQFGANRGSIYTFRTTLDTPPPVGSAPSVSTLAASGISRTTANINGEITPNRASTRYWFEYGKTPNLGQTTAFASAGEGSVKVPASLSLRDLEPSTTYYFRLNAQNQFGTVNGTILNFKTAGDPVVVAPSATTGTAAAVATTTATLRGTVDPHGASTTYWFEYSTDSLFGAVLGQTTARRTLGASANATSVEADVTGLTGNTTYYFRVVAENSAGIDRGDRMSFRTR